jgi:cytochrome oxidase Cu insertion factor (SCO1/SenC/PrrC family)
MPAMRTLCLAMLLTMATLAVADSAPLNEEDFRGTLGLGADVHMAYRDLTCHAVDFEGFKRAMEQPNVHADVERAVDGKAVTLTAKLRGAAACASSYPPITAMPPFDLRDLGGKRVTPGSLKGKPTLVSFFFSTCVPCILEVQPINHFAAERPQMNFLAVTFDEPEVAQAFVRRFGLRWRVVADARDFIDRMRVKQYPLMALFDAQGRLLGTRRGGARDELEAANVEPQLARWVDGLLQP